MKRSKPSNKVDYELEEWRARTNSIIPGGTQLYSKSSFLYNSTNWPTFFSKAKGIDVWNLSGRKYKDMSNMGVGSCILGYANQIVDRKVVRTIRSGVQSSLIAKEELILSEKLLQIHGWANMVRLFKAGGEAMSAAVRIARAATGRDKVIFSGYHGWADWYLAANLNGGDSLGQFLIKDLGSDGVPTSLKDTALPVPFDDFKEFKKVLKDNKDELAAVILEPRRSFNPSEGYLQNIIELSHSLGIVVIFDEITTAWRANSGGIHLSLGVNPDIAVFSKAMGNGYAISAVIGIREVMEAASRTFLSSTSWSERVGMAAAIATIDEYEKSGAAHKLLSFGNKAIVGWKELSNISNLNISLNEEMLPSLPYFEFNHPNARGMYSRLSELMINEGYLATNQFRPSTAHSFKAIERYLVSLSKSLETISLEISNFGDDYFLQFEANSRLRSLPRLTT